MYSKGLLLHYIYFKIKNKQKTTIYSDETLTRKKDSFNFKLTQFQNTATLRR